MGEICFLMKGNDLVIAGKIDVVESSYFYLSQTKDEYKDSFWILYISEHEDYVNVYNRLKKSFNYLDCYDKYIKSVNKFSKVFDCNKFFKSQSKCS